MTLPSRLLFGTADQFDNAAPTCSILDVLQRQLGDSLGVNRLGIDMAAKRQRSQDADFPAGIMTFDIRGRIALGIA